MPTPPPQTVTYPLWYKENFKTKQWRKDFWSLSKLMEIDGNRYEYSIHGTFKIQM